MINSISEDHPQCTFKSYYVAFDQQGEVVYICAPTIPSVVFETHNQQLTEDSFD